MCRCSAGITVLSAKYFVYKLRKNNEKKSVEKLLKKVFVFFCFRDLFGVSFTHTQTLTTHTHMHAHSHGDSPKKKSTLKLYYITVIALVLNASGLRPRRRCHRRLRRRRRRRLRRGNLLESCRGRARDSVGGVRGAKTARSWVCWTAS